MDLKKYRSSSKLILFQDQAEHHRLVLSLWEKFPEIISISKFMGKFATIKTMDSFILLKFSVRTNCLSIKRLKRPLICSYSEDQFTAFLDFLIIFMDYESNELETYFWTVFTDFNE